MCEAGLTPTPSQCKNASQTQTGHEKTGMIEGINGDEQETFGYQVTGVMVLIHHLRNRTAQAPSTT